MECEARHVLSLGGLMARRAYLELIESKRGADARKALEAVIRLEWSKRKAVTENDNERPVIDNSSKVSNG